MMRCCSLARTASAHVRLFSTTPCSSAANKLRRPEFDDASHAFALKSTPALFRSALLFKICSFDIFVQNARNIIKFARKMLPDPIVVYLIHKTLGEQFTGGRDDREVQQVIQQLKSQGVGGILDFAAEADVSEENGKAQTSIPADEAPMLKVPEKFQPDEHTEMDPPPVSSARTYRYASEDVCEQHYDNFRRCIETAAQQKDGFAAIKVTALINPHALMSLAGVEAKTRLRYPGKHDVFLLQEPNYSPLTIEPFGKFLQEHYPKLTDEQVADMFAKIDGDQDGYIDFIEWTRYWDSEEASSDIMEAMFIAYEGEHLTQKLNCKDRLDRLAEMAVDSGVTLMVDAEQTYYQPAIDTMVRLMMQKYNKQRAFIFNTYQAYLRTSYVRLCDDIESANRYKYHFGAKLVRGAYVRQERARAKTENYSDPIQATIELTHANYDRCTDRLLQEVADNNARIMVASHNETSCLHAADTIIRNPKISTDGVVFAQLLGMCDHISMNLAAAGFNVFKYVPYGPTLDVSEYLIRRVEENSSMLGGASVKREQRLVQKELLRRLCGSSPTPPPRDLAGN
eukprot:m.137700 g.137700  ORF g.137700 m.137700 type:complete len:568 (+) comp24001_c1_seq5:19-1722(+)